MILTWLAVIPEVHCGVGSDRFLKSLYGDNRKGFKEGESVPARGEGGLVSSSSSSSKPPVSSTTINGSCVEPMSEVDGVYEARRIIFQPVQREKSDFILENYNSVNYDKAAPTILI